MANGNYWIKLYHEILDDPKIGRLRVALKWRFIECLLVAGEIGKEGMLPSSDDLAWRIRCDPDKLETDLNELADGGLLDRVDGTWRVTKFKKRQEPSKAALRMRKYRKRKREEKESETDAEADTYRARNALRNGSVTENNNQQQIDPLIKPAIEHLVTAWLDLVGGSKPANTDLCKSKLYDPAKQLLNYVDADYPRAFELVKKKRSEMLANNKTPKWLEAVVPYIIAEFDKPKAGDIPEDWGSNAIKFEQ